MICPGILDNVNPGTPEKRRLAWISETHGPVGDTAEQIPAPNDN